MNVFRIVLSVYLLSLFVLPSHAQSLRSAYPVQVTAFLPPPHSLYLGDYCSSTKEKLVVNLLNRTIAHELAHGKFRLRHTFDSEYGQVEELARGGTKNLMDYGTGTELAKWQWDEIFNPALLVSPFESDEEAMSPWTTSAPDFDRFSEPIF